MLLLRDPGRAPFRSAVAFVRSSMGFFAPQSDPAGLGHSAHTIVRTTLRFLRTGKMAPHAPLRRGARAVVDFDVLDADSVSQELRLSSRSAGATVLHPI